MSYPNFGSGSCAGTTGPAGPPGPPGPPGLIPPNTFTARRLVEGIDYTVTQGFATDVVNYPEGDFNVGFWSASWGQPTFSPATPAGTVLNRFSQWNWRQRNLDPTDLHMAQNLFINSNQGQIPLTITGTQQIYFADGTTPRSVQITATGVLNGATLQLDMAVNYDPENPGSLSLYNAVFAYVTLIENNMPPDGSTITFSSLQFTMPAATVAYEREYAVVIELNEPFVFPETMQIRYQATYDCDTQGVRNGTAIVTTLRFPPEFFTEITTRAITSRTPPVLDFNDPNTLGELIWHEGKMLARGNRIGFEFPNWNFNMRVTAIEILDVVKRSLIN